VPGSVVDLVLIVLIIMFAVNGYRQGFLIAALSFFGFFGGALVGLQAAPFLVANVGSPLYRAVLSIASVFGVALIGQWVAGWAGDQLRDAIRSPAARRVDNVAGIFVSVLALLLVAWMVAGPLGSSTLPALNASVRNSVILNAVDSVMPNEARVLYDSLRDTIANGDFPNVFGDLTPTRARQVAPPDAALANSSVVRDAQDSVVKIIGNAPSCRRRIEGSGFVISPQHVMTNAHVVAGTQGALAVQVGDATPMRGWVVAYNSNEDLAVVYVPGLTSRALPWSPTVASTGDDAIVLGYPLNGPYTASPARIRDLAEVRGPDIYESTTVVRQIYTIRGNVRSGNSGGPLLDTAGELLGVIFAAALDDQTVGFALSENEARPIATADADLISPVSTGACV
jgi:S1-C subfamily serine protease